jgi:hypothetical protein
VEHRHGAAYGALPRFQLGIARIRAHVGELRQCGRGQDAQNYDHHNQFDQGEASLYLRTQRTHVFNLHLFNTPVCFSKL